MEHKVTHVRDDDKFGAGIRGLLAAISYLIDQGIIKPGSKEKESKEVSG